MVNQQCGNCSKVISGILWLCNHCGAVKDDRYYPITWTVPYNPEITYGNIVSEQLYGTYLGKEDMDKCTLEAKIEELECKMRKLEGMKGSCTELEEIKCFFQDKWSNQPKVFKTDDEICVKVYTDNKEYNGRTTLPYMFGKGYYLKRINYSPMDTTYSFYRTLVFSKIC